MKNIVELLESFSKNEIHAEELLKHITERELNYLLNSSFSDIKNSQLLTQGESINVGDVSGYLVINKKLAEILFSEARKRNTSINIVYSPIKGDITDFANIRECVGFFTEQKGSTTFCSLQASCEGKPTIGGVNCNHIVNEEVTKKIFEFSDQSTIEINTENYSMVFDGNYIVSEGDIISINEQDGYIYRGPIQTDISRIDKVYSTLAAILIEFKNNSSYKSIVDTPTYQLNERFLINEIQSDLFNGFQKLLKYCYQKTKLKIYSTAHTPETIAYSGLIASDIAFVGNEITINQRKKDFGLGLLRDERIWGSSEEIDLLRLIFLGEKISKVNYKVIRDKYVSTLSDKLHDVFKIGTGSIAVVRLDFYVCPSLCYSIKILISKNSVKNTV